MEGGRIENEVEETDCGTTENWQSVDSRCQGERYPSEYLRFFLLVLWVSDASRGGEQGGVTYISQVLKRNRTLKVLNLSENKIDMLGLVSIAEALVSLHLRFPTSLAQR
jgi:hypothetical protein